MSAFMFYCRNAINSLKANKLLNLIVVLSITVAMMYPLIACTISAKILLDAKLSEYKDKDNTSVLEFFAPYMEQAEMNDNIKKLTEDIDVYGYQAVYTVSAQWKESRLLTTVGGYSPDYLTLEGNELQKGRLITKEELSGGKPVCMAVTHSRHDFKIGDEVSVMGNSYKIVGTLYMPKSYAGILIPYRSLENFIGKNNIQYKVLLHTKQKSDISEIKGNLNFADLILSIGTARDNVKPYYDSIWSLIIERIGIGLIVLLFSIISMVMIIIGKTIDSQYTIGVKMSVGASATRIFIDTFLQNSILMISALLLDFLLFPIVKHYYNLLNSYPGIWVFVVMLILCLIIALVVSLLGVTVILKNKSPSVLLKT